MRTVRHDWLAGGALVALGAVAVPIVEALLSDYLVTLACIVLIYVMLTVSLQVTNGLTGLFSLGHPAFMTIGAYVAAILTYPTPPGMLHLVFARSQVAHAENQTHRHERCEGHARCRGGDHR